MASQNSFVLSNPPIVLATSIPPCLRGQDYVHSNSHLLQNHALQSWIEVTPLIISIHTSSEIAAHSSLAISLSSAGVKTAILSEYSGCFCSTLPQLSASLQWIADNYPNSLVVVTNSDIILSHVDQFRESIAALRPNEVFLARRLNIESVSDNDGTPDNAGFDLFCFHSSAISRVLPFLPLALQFGIPWWDLYFPLACIAAGLKLVKPHMDYCLHPNHSDRWNADAWFDVGLEAYYSFQASLRSRCCTSLSHTLRRLKRQAHLDKFRSPHSFARYLNGQKKSLAARHRLSPLYLFPYAVLLNRFLDNSSRFHLH